MKKIQSRIVAQCILMLLMVFAKTEASAQVELKVDVFKALTLLQFEFGMEHYLSEKISLNHQLSFPGTTKNLNDQGKPFNLRYMNEARIYYWDIDNPPFISLTQRMSSYQSFTDYELGFLLGWKFNSKTQPFSLEFKTGYLRSLNNQFEFNQFFGPNPVNNALINFSIGFKL